MVALRRPVVATVAALVLAVPVAVPAAANDPAGESAPDHEAQRTSLDGLDESLRRYAEEQLSEHAHAVDDALLALSRIESDLAAATDAAEKARAEADAARAEAEATERALEGVRLDQLRTTRRLAAVSERVVEIRQRLGAVARMAYRSGGSFVGWSAGTPYQLAEAQAEQRATRERLRDLRLERRRLIADTAEASARAEAAEAAALEAAASRDEIRAEHAEALAAAEAARAEEDERYQEFLAESEAIEEWLAEYGLDETIEGTGTFSRPGTGTVTSAFGPRLHPILGYVKTHTGIDLGIGDGFVYAADHGIVVEAAWNDAYGYLVVVDHGVIDGRQVSTLYAHQPGLSVDVGMPVAKGQPIGSIGSTGYSTGPHLHFEVRVGGSPVDPWPWIRSARMPEPME
jgi:murein DD-endopeptidase MepM/ murein hydrolase activator NlpD